MRHAAKITSRILLRFWRGLREWCGDAAYETYLRSKGTQSSPSCKLTPAEFTWNNSTAATPSPTAAVDLAVHSALARSLPWE
jgi:hypothetical protein